jgi:hypothetical protein
MANNHHSVTEERYQFVEWLYRIRAHHGNHYGFLQPDFICIIFGKLIVSKYQRTDADIHTAVDAWCDDPEIATEKYGHISKWNTSLVTDMKGLFGWYRNFNDDISTWDLNSVTDMSNMFLDTPFNGDISRCDVSSVTNMKFMFRVTSSFTGDISGWQISDSCETNDMFIESPIPEEHKPAGGGSTI